MLSMGQTLERSAKLSKDQKAILRSLVCKAFSSEEESARREMVAVVASDITETLAPNLSALRETFHSELCAFLQSASDIWVSLQRSCEWITATVDFRHSPEHWAPVSGLTESAIPVAPLFPQIIAGNDDPLFGGLAVWSNDPVFNARDEASPPKAVDRKPSTHDSAPNGPKTGARPETANSSHSERTPLGIRGTSRRLKLSDVGGRSCNGIVRPS